MQLNHDKIVCQITNINPRSEIHGEDFVLALDIAVTVSPEDGPAFTEVIRALGMLDEGEDLAAYLEGMRAILREAPFAAEFEGHKVRFWQSTKNIATFPSADINKFRLQFPSDASKGMSLSFRVQAVTTGAQVGKLAELLKAKVRLEVVANQEELDLDNTGDAEEQE